jgi:quinol monooxygenase YgiN
MIHVIATIELNPGTRDAFLVEFKKVTEEVRGEPGCIEYGATVDEPTPLAVQDEVGPNAVVVVEKWESLDALLGHLKAGHMVEYRQRVQDYVRGVRLMVLRPV